MGVRAYGARTSSTAINSKHMAYDSIAVAAAVCVNTHFKEIEIEARKLGEYEHNNFACFHFVGKSKEAEIKRINKELANIRSNFKGDKTLDGYKKKKYVCKLLFIFLLGHDIDFGHMEAVNLLSSNKYSEKQIVSSFRKTCSSILTLLFSHFSAAATGIFVHFGAGEHKQRSHPVDHSEHQK